MRIWPQRRSRYVSIGQKACLQPSDSKRSLSCHGKLGRIRGDALLRPSLCPPPQSRLSYLLVILCITLACPLVDSIHYPFVIPRPRNDPEDSILLALVAVATSEDTYGVLAGGSNQNATRGEPDPNKLTCDSMDEEAAHLLPQYSRWQLPVIPSPVM